MPSKLLEDLKLEYHFIGEGEDLPDVEVNKPGLKRIIDHVESSENLLNESLELLENFYVTRPPTTDEAVHLIEVMTKIKLHIQSYQG